MITISTCDYTTEQLKDLAYGLSMAQDKIFERYKCEYDIFCNRECKAYAICNDIFNAWRYLYDTIREREIDEEYRVMQKRGFEYDND